MHDANGLLTFQGWLFISVCGVMLLTMGCVALAYFAVLMASEDRYAMDRDAQAEFLSAPRRDDKERRDDAADLGVVSSVQLEIARDRARRPTSSVSRRLAEAREGRRVPPNAAA